MNALAESSEHSLSEIIGAVRQLRAITGRTRRNQYFRLDRYDATGYFCGYDAWQLEIKKYFQSIRNIGESPIFVDLCGRTTGAWFGAQKSYTFSLQAIERSFLPRANHVIGDIFSARDFGSFIRLLRDNGEFPALVAFEPVAGLQPYTPKSGSVVESVTYQILKAHLAKIFEIVRPGGYIFIEPPFQLTNLADFFQGKNFREYDSSLWLKDFCKSRKSRLTMGYGSRMELHYLIRKRG